jgi:hypothetical protein
MVALGEGHAWYLGLLYTIHLGNRLVVTLGFIACWYFRVTSPSSGIVRDLTLYGVLLFHLM